MAISCGCDPEYYVDLSEELATSVGTETCAECRDLIHVGIEHYHVREWNYDEYGDEIELGQHRCCEECGDLALSVMELGYCWGYGELRDTIVEHNDYL